MNYLKKEWKKEPCASDGEKNMQPCSQPRVQPLPPQTSTVSDDRVKDPILDNFLFIVLTRPSSPGKPATTMLAIDYST